MRILVTFAVQAEFAAWRKMRSFKKLHCAGVDAYSASVEKAELNVLLTGVGAKKAWAAAAQVICNGDVDVCISSGLAGALKSEHRAGDILAAREVHGGSGNEVVTCDRELVELAALCGAKAVGSFYSADHVASRAEEKRELGALADAVDMESEGILHEAAAWGARGVAIRAISDAVGEDLPVDFNRTITDSGELSVGRVLRQVAKNPGSLAALVRFGKQSRQSAEALAVFLDRYIGRMGRPGMLATDDGAAAR